VRNLLVYLAVIFAGGALLAPWLYWTVQWAATQASLFEPLAKQPFHRFVSRSMLVLALVGLGPFLSRMGIRGWSEVGLPSPRKHGRELGFGLLLGFASLACVALASLAAGATEVKQSLSAGKFLSELGQAAASAAVVGVLEELVFRGALFGALRRVHPWGRALIISSALYALVHFFQRPGPPSEVSWGSGAVVLGQMLGGFAHVSTLVPTFFTLTLAGTILGLGCQRTGTLYFSIGLHAGWIFWLKLFGAVTHPAVEDGNTFWGTGKLVDSWLAMLLLGLLCAVVWRGPSRASLFSAGGSA
jgi:hypothetical protein